MVDIGEIVLRVAGRPWRHHEALQRLGTQIAAARLDEFANDIVRSRIDFTTLPPRPVRSAWNLLKSRFIKIIETFEAFVVGRLVFRQFEAAVAFVLVPIAHQNALRRPFIEIQMVPSVVAPCPCTHAVLFDRTHDVEEIMLP